MKRGILIFAAGAVLGSVASYLTLAAIIRGPNKIAFSAPMGLLSSITISETPEELALKSIKQLCNGPAYNRSNDTTEEIIKAQLMNSEFRLSYLAASENLSEELKICLALKLIAQDPNKLYWAPTQHVLALHLQQIQDATSRSLTKKEIR